MAEAWETIIGQGLVNLAGNNVCSNNVATSLLFGVTANCGLYVLGILCLLVFIIYGFSTGVSSEVIIFIVILLTFYLASWGFLPLMLGFFIVLASSVVIYKVITRSA